MSRFALPLLLFLSSAAFGQGDEEKCCCSTVEVAACLARSYKEADGMLNRTYRDALAAVARYYTEQDAQNLKDAERLWVAYRDAACKAESGLWGAGTGAPGARVVCLIRLTRIRTDELKRAYLSHRQVRSRPAPKSATHPVLAALDHSTAIPTPK